MAPIMGKVTKNLALNCPVEASSCKSEERTAANVVDGSPVSRWTSRYEDGEWLSIDLGAVCTVSEVRIRWEMAHAESYLLQGSSDGESFVTMAQENGREGWVATRLPSACQARWVRMFGQTRATSFGFSIWEMQVLGEQAASGGATGTVAGMPAGKTTSWNNSSWFEVVHERVAIRSQPSTKGKMVSAAKKGEGFRGNKILVQGQPWLILDEGWVKECRSDIAIPSDVTDLYVLIDGKSVGLGVLLRPGVEPAATASKARGPPPAKEAEKGPTLMAKPQAETSSRVKEAPKAPTPKPFMPESEWVVQHEKVVERAEPNVNGKAKKIRERGELVQGVPCYVGSNPWLQLDSGGWMLIDGKCAGVPGKLLYPAADIATDIIKWAEQHRNSEAGKKVVWSAQTDTELRNIEEVAWKQVGQLGPMLNFPVVLERLERDGFIEGDDFTLGPEGVGKAVCRKVMRKRAGVLVLGEEPKDADSLPWSEQDFSKYVAKIIPDTPFSCRTFTPEEAPSRLLILLHGSLVTGDDLVAEAETLRKIMPETAVVLPEGPVVASKELGLRVWWAPPDDAPRDVSDIRDARDHGLLKAPPAAVSRLVATVQWARKRFKGVPFILGGFSQGSMLVVQSLGALKAEGLVPHGVVVLSGLVAPFEVPPKVAALALHGDEDDRIELDLVLEVAREPKMKQALKLEEIPGMGHEINDAVVDRVVKFCDEAAPVVRTLARQEESEWVQEVNQAKLLRWVKKVSQVITMFDDPRFMSHIQHMNMLGLGTDCPGLGKGPLFRYLVHDVGPECRGHVVVFHGKVYDLKRETRKLVEAYQRLKLSVVVVDYRQKFSQFCVDATVVLEALGEITGSETSPVIVHSTGCGAIAGLHMAIASQAYPSNLKRRMRLLVLDGAVGNFRSLPPSPTGCIATDPIGNDEKLKYIGMPLALFGGDDACCGLKWSAGHWTVLSRQAEMLRDDGKLLALTMNTGLVLMPSATESRLSPDLYRACENALDSVQRSAQAAELFTEDVLSSADIADQSEYRKYKEEDLRKILEKVLEEAEQNDNVLRLWYIRAEREPKRGEELTKFIAGLHQPHLEAHGGFRQGFAGFQQFEGAVAALGELNAGLMKAREKVREAFNVKRLDEQAEKLLADKGQSQGVTLDQCHWVLDSAIQEWSSQELFDRLVEQVRQNGGTPAQARLAIKEHSAGMNIKRAQQLGFEGTEDEMNMKLNIMFSCYQGFDPTLPIKMKKVTEGAMQCMSAMNQMFKAAPGAKALPGRAAKEQDVDVEVVVEHAMEGGSVAVTVKSSASMMDVRRTVMAKLGETKLSQVKFVSRTNESSGFTALADDQKIAERRRLLMLGRSLGGQAPKEVPTEEPARDTKVVLTIHIDRQLGLVSRVRVPHDATIRAVKAELAREDSAMDAHSLGLRLPGASDSACLPDDWTITGFDALELCAAPAAAEPPPAAHDLELTVFIDRALGLSSLITVKPGSRIFAVKELLAQADPTGSTKAEDFGLRLPGSGDGPEGQLDDAQPITPAMTELDVCLPR